MNRKAAVIFDLDGTLTKPCLDFDKIRAEIGLPAGPILEALPALSPAEQERAWVILERHEREAAEKAELHDGAVEVITACREMGFGVAILTRNVRYAVNMVLERFGIIIDALRTREDGAVKPSAAPVLSICDELSADARRSWMVGDYIFDIMSGRAAGTKTVLMLGDTPKPAFAGEADYVINRLVDLLAIIEADGTPQ